MKFQDNKGVEQWYEGVLSPHNVFIASTYFPSDGYVQTEEAYFDNEDLEIVH